MLDLQSMTNDIINNELTDAFDLMDLNKQRIAELEEELLRVRRQLADSIVRATLLEKALTRCEAQSYLDQDRRPKKAKKKKK